MQENLDFLLPMLKSIAHLKSGVAARNTEATLCNPCTIAGRAAKRY